MVKIVHNIAGYQTLRHDPALQTECERIAATVAEKAESLAHVKGAKYAAQPNVIPYRGGASIRATNYKGRLDNAKHNTLLKALGDGT